MPNNVLKNLHTISAKAEKVSVMLPDEISSEQSVVNDLNDGYSDYQEILRLLNSTQDDIKAILAPHESILASDDQYYDPEYSWASNLLDNINEAKDELESCANDLDYIISILNVGEDIDSSMFLMYEYEIENFIKIINKAVKESR